MRNRVRIRWLLALLAVLHAIVLFAGFVAPYDPQEQNRDLAYVPPVKVHFSGASGSHIRPFVYAVVSDAEGPRDDLTREYPLHLFVRGSSYSILGLFRSDLHLLGVDSPARLMLFGSDAFGRGQ